MGQKVMPEIFKKVRAVVLSMLLVLPLLQAENLKVGVACNWIFENNVWKEWYGNLDGHSEFWKEEGFFEMLDRAGINNFFNLPQPPKDFPIRQPSDLASCYFDLMVDKYEHISRKSRKAVFFTYHGAVCNVFYFEIDESEIKNVAVDLFSVKSPHEHVNKAIYGKAACEESFYTGFIITGGLVVLAVIGGIGLYVKHYWKVEEEKKIEAGKKRFLNRILIKLKVLFKRKKEEDEGEKMEDGGLKRNWLGIIVSEKGRE